MYCLGEVRVLAVPMQVAVALRDVARRHGIASETAASYASLQWCAKRVPTVTAVAFGTHAMGPEGLPAKLVASPQGGWLIDDSSLVIHDSWLVVPTAVSIGLAMDRQWQRSSAATRQQIQDKQPSFRFLKNSSKRYN